VPAKAEEEGKNGEIQQWIREVYIMKNEPFSSCTFWMTRACVLVPTQTGNDDGGGREISPRVVSLSLPICTLFRL
jgi:hypothetical protein